MTAFSLLRTLAIPSAALLFAVIQAPTSHADAAEFYNDVSSIGITSVSGEQGIAGVGYGICRDLMSGKTREAVAADLFYKSAVGETSNGITLEQARDEVAFAVDDLCPPSVAGVAL